MNPSVRTSARASKDAAPASGVLLQYFHWNLEDDGSHWRRLEREAPALAAAGFTHLWLPPATKGSQGSKDAGYGLYDPYDLGEFDQKGSVRTRYGTKREYLAAIRAAHRAGIAVLSDVVLNHLDGADATERGRAVRVDANDRTRETGPDATISAWTRFFHPGRSGAHSSFAWSWEHFTAVGWAQNLLEKGIFKLRRASREGWSEDVDRELGNFDYLLMNDLDLDHPEVRGEWERWGRWYLAESGVDGFRLDAAKHMSFGFTSSWLEAMRVVRPDLFVVAEYWSHDLGKLSNYVERMKGRVSLFDFVLQDRLNAISRERGYFDLRRVLEGTFTRASPERAVTFVDNHDTQREPYRRSMAVADWFKPGAYALLLLRREGFPSVFYLDYLGEHRSAIEKLLSLRRDHAHGTQHDYFDHEDIVGWTREGDEGHPAAMAVMLSDSFGPMGEGVKRMFVGKRPERGMREFRDRLGNFTGTVSVGPDGMGEFPVLRASDSRPVQSLSIWVEEFPPSRRTAFR